MEKISHPAKIHHLTSDETQKRSQLFEFFNTIESKDLSKTVILTTNNLTADYLAYRLNIKGMSTGSIHNFKSASENLKTIRQFNDGKLRILVTNQVDFKLSLSSVKQIINYDMYTPNILYFEALEFYDYMYPN